MKKLILLLLFIPFVFFGQTYEVETTYDPLMNSSKSTIKKKNSPYGRKTYTPNIKPFSPNLNQLNNILKARQKRYYNNSQVQKRYYNNSQGQNTYSSKTKKLTFYDIISDKWNRNSLGLKLTNFNSEERKAIKAKQTYDKFKSRPLDLYKGQYTASVIVFDSNKDVKFVDNKAIVEIDAEGKVSFIFCSSVFGITLPIMSYNETVKKSMDRERKKASTDSEFSKKLDNFTWQLITYREKSKLCFAEILVQGYSNNLVKRGKEYSVVLLFNDKLAAAN